ncbi:reticulon-like protein B21 [Zingiber officinale]|uniref:reticulon-like protein B21 n=1 Tax=Zingiber officinale TaxID=94328 RepID=UPI001C4D6A9D|nr:reticulon-like protein B21 [Zingiber officinale]
MQACIRRRALSRSSRAGGNGGGGARLRKSQSDSAASVEKRKKSNFAAADKEESGGSSAVQLKKSLSDLPFSRTDQREMFVNKEMDKNGEKPRSAEEEEEQIPVSVEDEEKNQSLESLLSVDVVEKEQIVLVADRNAEEEEEEEEDSEMQCVENAAMNLESEAQPPPPHGKHLFIQSVEREEQQEQEEQEEQEEKCEVVSSTRMQSIEDLVLWKDASRSALVFGFGTFLLLSSSYAEEVHFSMISASSYVGLTYLAFVFLCKSFIRRGEEQSQCDESCNVVEEEDAIWLLKMLLPYINELLLKLKTLFSGDPSTTLKLAGVLFVMARCGSNITIWSLVRLMFFGVFIVPKACCSYSSYLTKLGRFWLDRVRDGWESCTHKKAVAVAIFCVIWNISSTIARVWSFFMLVVAVKLYQQSAAENSSSREEEGEEQKEGQEDSMAGQSQLLKLH